MLVTPTGQTPVDSILRRQEDKQTGRKYQYTEKGLEKCRLGPVRSFFRGCPGGLSARPGAPAPEGVTLARGRSGRGSGEEWGYPGMGRGWCRPGGGVGEEWAGPGPGFAGTCLVWPPAPTSRVGGLWTKWRHLLPAPVERPGLQPEQEPRSRPYPAAGPGRRARSSSNTAAMLARKRRLRGRAAWGAPARSRLPVPVAPRPAAPSTVLPFPSGLLGASRCGGPEYTRDGGYRDPAPGCVLRPRRSGASLLERVVRSRGHGAERGSPREPCPESGRSDPDPHPGP